MDIIPQPKSSIYSTESVEFNPNDLKSKEGFNDGKLLNPLIDKLVRMGMVPSMNPELRSNVLKAVLDKHILPKITNAKLVVKMLSTDHNPCRIESLNEIPYNELNKNELNSLTFNPETIIIPSRLITQEIIRLSN